MNDTRALPPCCFFSRHPSTVNDSEVVPLTSTSLAILESPPTLKTLRPFRGYEWMSSREFAHSRCLQPTPCAALGSNFADDTSRARPTSEALVWATASPHNAPCAQRFIMRRTHTLHPQPNLHINDSCATLHRSQCLQRHTVLRAGSGAPGHETLLPDSHGCCDWLTIFAFPESWITDCCLVASAVRNSPFGSTRCSLFPASLLPTGRSVLACGNAALVLSSPSSARVSTFAAAKSSPRVHHKALHLLLFATFVFPERIKHCDVRRIDRASSLTHGVELAARGFSALTLYSAAAVPCSVSGSRSENTERSSTMGHRCPRATLVLLKTARLD
ncbi:hypothetical protein B0H14DRAFT_3509927 [Mycena olivaceomarginata]|nr:hypothetical protein B0H14DRAFT_3509927 [Mycena olivaceomarginata]